MICGGARPCACPTHWPVCVRHSVSTAIRNASAETILRRSEVKVLQRLLSGPSGPPSPFHIRSRSMHHVPAHLSPASVKWIGTVCRWDAPDQPPPPAACAPHRTGALYAPRGGWRNRARERGEREDGSRDEETVKEVGEGGERASVQKAKLLSNISLIFF